MKSYKRSVPVAKYATGGPGPTRRYNFGNLSPEFLEDPITPVTSSTPPGAGPQITLTPNSTGAYSPVSTIPSSSITMRKGMNWNRVGDIASGIAPYASNIINAFRKPPMPGKPVMDAPPVFQKVNLENERNQVNRIISAADIAADRGLESNAATSVRQFNMGQRLNELSRVNAAETAANTQIANQQAMANYQVGAGNNAKLDDYNQALVDRTIAQQREQSANVANAADKFVGIQNEKRRAAVDLAKTRTLMSMYEKSGVLQRQGKAWKSQGMEDPLGMNYKWLKN